MNNVDNILNIGFFLFTLGDNVTVNVKAEGFAKKTWGNSSQKGVHALNEIYQIDNTYDGRK